MRDQLIGLSYALLITGLILTPLEFLILDGATFMKISPFLFGPLIAGAIGLYYFKYRDNDTSASAGTDATAPSTPQSSDDNSQA